MSRLDLVRPADPAEFETLARPLLAPREAENNLIFGLVSNLKAGRRYGPDAPFFAVVTEGDRVVGAAMRTPPFHLILAAGTDRSAVEPILERLERETDDLSGVNGPTDVASLAAKAWSERTGRSSTRAMALRIYRLTHVRPPRTAPGRMRAATPDDLDLVTDWMRAFSREAGTQVRATPEEERGNAERWIVSGGLRLWEDGGVASMAGASGPTPNGIRIGAVYTPPDRRRRGYASALVAALSQEQLDRGRNFCFLFTDLANPTSNKIYQDIGYEPVSDVDDYRFSA